MKKNESFSVRARGKSFRHAFDGLVDFFRREHNARIHLFLTMLVFGTTLFFDISRSEMLVLILAAGFVWSAEIFNTAVEAIMDHVSPSKHPRVKFIKDVSAAAVLVAAFTAFVAGSIIFIPKLF